MLSITDIICRVYNLGLENIKIEEQKIVLRQMDGSVKILNATQIDDLEVLSQEKETYVLLYTFY